MKLFLVNIIFLFLRGILMLLGLMVFGCTHEPPPPLSKQQQEEKMHLEHANLADNLAHRDIIILDEQIRPPREFGQVFSTFFGSYLRLGEALVKMDTQTIDKAAEQLKFVLELIPGLVKGDTAINTWKSHRERYLKNVMEFLQSQNLEEKRVYYSYISEILYCTLKSFRMEIGDIHMAYCPTSFDNKGGYWLTDSHKIRNPYAGNEQPKCGSIVEIIQ